MEGHGTNRHVDMPQGGRRESELLLYPRLPEQRKIAAVLSLVQRAIEQQERLIALTTELKQALMHKLFTEGLHGEPQKLTEIGRIPESWVVSAVGEVATLRSGGTPSRKQLTYWKTAHPLGQDRKINYRDITKHRGVHYRRRLA